MYYVAKASFESQSSSYNVPSAETVGVHHHSWLWLTHFNVYTELTEKLSGGKWKAWL